MFRIMLISALLASTGASRAQVRDQKKSHTQFGASCERLQTMFHDRVAAFQTALDAIPDTDEMSRSAQARVLMRTYGIMRTLRRARACSWVVQNDSEELEQVRGIVQTLLAGSPCADAARSEIEAGMSAETSEGEIQSIGRAVLVLSSDTCEVEEQTEEPVDTDVPATLDDRLAEAESNLQDAIDNIEDGESSLIQVESKAGSLRGFLRGVGIAFLLIFMLLACVGAVMAVGVVLGIAVMFLFELTTYGRTGCQGPSCLGLLLFPLAGFYGGGALGLVGCIYQLYTQMLPRIRQ